MIQAMIAAANADYELDAEERDRIVRTMEESGLDETERKVLLGELEKPLDLATLAAKATTPALRRDVYLASEMAISADTKAEQNYLARLAKQLRSGGRGSERAAQDPGRASTRHGAYSPSAITPSRRRGSRTRRALLRRRRPNAPGVAAHLAVLDESALGVRLDVDLDRLSAVRAGNEESDPRRIAARRAES